MVCPAVADQCDAMKIFNITLVEFLFMQWVSSSSYFNFCSFFHQVSSAFVNEPSYKTDEVISFQ